MICFEVPVWTTAEDHKPLTPEQQEEEQKRVFEEWLRSYGLLCSLDFTVDCKRKNTGNHNER